MSLNAKQPYFEHCLGLKRHHYRTIPRSPCSSKLRFFSGILTAHIIDCRKLPLYTRELLGCLLGISSSGQNPCNFIYHDLRLGYQWWNRPFKMATTVYERYGKPLTRDLVAIVVFLIQIFVIFSSCCNRYF